ncbi:rho GTPase-activating protein 36 isoform X2 [Cyprinodon tularosa]|uniref:rho GTPase-activating protein 36 isoform X2 n=1 Tax=Cyprinodon tularosa TaxID=77115 RepID=UPI0018E20AD9|nr:rho GTPase-activating protein 36 isoform X2 [Cyprinodon tularosa]
MQFYYVGDHTWATMLGQSVRLQPVPIQSLSELERARLQEVALYHLEERDLDFKISIPREIRKRRKSLRRRFDSFSKEKKERDAPKAFGIPLSQAIANDQAYKRRQDALKESRRDCLDLEASVLRFRAEKRQFFNGNKPLGSSSSITGGGPGSPSANSVAPAPCFDTQSKPLSPTFMDNTSRGQRRGGLSVDCLSDLVESQSRLLEALQLSHPAELELKKSASEGRTQTKLSLNPIYRQVPRVVERCCSHIENYGLQTVGIFRVGSSKKRVRQLREDFDMGVDVQLDEEHSVHDVAALLKEFLRDMPDPLLPRELYPAFLHANLLRGADQLQYLQHLLYLLPPCNCDTLLRLLSMLQTVQSYAQDTIGTNDEEIPGNKMTAANLAVIFGPNLLQRETGGDVSPQAMGIEDSTAIISITLVLIQNYKRLFTVSAELQQEVLMSLIQTDPDVIDYLLRRKLSGSHLTVEGSSESGARRDTGASLDSVGASSGSLSPLEPPSPLFPPDGNGGEGSLTSEVFLNVLKLNQNRNRPEGRYGAEGRSTKSIRHMRQFHSHHNLLSLSQPSSLSRMHSQDGDPQDRRGALGAAMSFALGSSSSRGSCSSLSGSTENSIWVRQMQPDEGKSSPAANFWDFFTGKGSSSETVV